MFDFKIVKYGKVIHIKAISLIGGGTMWMNIGTKCIITSILKSMDKDKNMTYLKTIITFYN